MWGSRAGSGTAEAGTVGQHTRKGSRERKGGPGAWATVGDSGPAWGEGGQVGPKRNSIRFDLFKKISNGFELIRFKYGLNVLERFQIKYGIVGDEIRNNFPYWNFSEFGLEFESKIVECSRC
jgi:hypothetical protein